MQAALVRGSKVWVVTDGSQARGSTKMQLQAVKMIREAGALVRLCCGGSVSTAYGEDKRDVRVGGKLKGLHHAKTVLVRYFHDFRKSSRSTLPSHPMGDWIVQFYYLKQGQRGSWSIPAVEPRFHPLRRIGSMP